MDSSNAYEERDANFIRSHAGILSSSTNSTPVRDRPVSGSQLWILLFLSIVV